MRSLLTPLLGVLWLMAPVVAALESVVTQPVPGGDGDATLHELQLSEGPPSPGFMLSAMAGELPEGDVATSPAFDLGVTSYTVAVAEAELTIRARAAPESSVAVSGRSSTGEDLSVGNSTFIGNVSRGGEDYGAFLSATVSGLAAGENAIEIAVTAEGGSTQSYTLIVTR